MNSYFVESGPLRATVTAEDAFEAAMDAVRWWAESTTDSSRISYQNDLDDEVFVRPSSANWRKCERFLTVEVIAFVNREPTEEAWEALLRELVSDN
ncbi:MAG: hypothetical protein ACI9HK_002926 [Pirellulaceae bacterium]|jgi:hypothetical protein